MKGNVLSKNEFKYIYIQSSNKVEMTYILSIFHVESSIKAKIT